ncbi:hypothetical protein B0H14DRAFT_2592356 [Mycena olivaceomarginata]|nr:hypothetical protein B0H14DRAFT_2592356 [Mycena olivaceomarginata]
MLALQQDPNCSDIQTNSVLCLPCNKRVNLGKASTYNVALWEAHVIRPTHQKKVLFMVLSAALNQYGASQMGPLGPSRLSFDTILNSPHTAPPYSGSPDLLSQNGRNFISPEGTKQQHTDAIAEDGKALPDAPTASGGVT